MVELKELFVIFWCGKDVFVEVKKLNGEVFCELEICCILCFELFGKSYFFKWYKGMILKEIIKNLFLLWMFVLGADREWYVIYCLSDVGVDIMKGIGFGEKGLNLLICVLFIIIEDFIFIISFEDYCVDWAVNLFDICVKCMLIVCVVIMVCKMYIVGINYCDCYICYFLFYLLFIGWEDELKILVIDLYWV